MNIAGGGATTFSLTNSLLVGEYKDRAHKKIALNELFIRPGASSVTTRINFSDKKGHWMKIIAINEAKSPDGADLQVPTLVGQSEQEPAYAGYQWTAHFMPEGAEESDIRHVIVTNPRHIASEPEPVVSPAGGVYDVSAEKTANGVAIGISHRRLRSSPQLHLPDTIASDILGVINTELKMLDDDLVANGAPKRQSIFYQNL